MLDIFKLSRHAKVSVHEALVLPFRLFALLLGNVALLDVEYVLVILPLNVLASQFKNWQSGRRQRVVSVLCVNGCLATLDIFFVAQNFVNRRDLLFLFGAVATRRKIFRLVVSVDQRILTCFVCKSLVKFRIFALLHFRHGFGAMEI